MACRVFAVGFPCGFRTVVALGAAAWLFPACALPRLEIDESAVGGSSNQGGVIADGGTQGEAGASDGGSSGEEGGTSEGRGGATVERGGMPGSGGQTGRGGTPGNGGQVERGGEPGVGGVMGLGGVVGSGGVDNQGGWVSSEGGSAGSGVICSSSSGVGLPLDESGWIARECNPWGIQGAYYCYSDEIAPCDCTTDRSPWDPARGAMCLGGQTVVDTSYEAWGAGLGLTLSSVEGSEVKDPYDATAYGVVGFEITLTGNTGEQPFRVHFTQTGTATDTIVAPFIEYPGFDGTRVVYPRLEDAEVPPSWDKVDNPGDRVDPTHIYDIQIAIVGGNAAASYDFCVSAIEPLITDEPVPEPADRTGGAIGVGGTLSD